MNLIYHMIIKKDFTILEMVVLMITAGAFAVTQSWVALVMGGVAAGLAGYFSGWLSKRVIQLDSHQLMTGAVLNHDDWKELIKNPEKNTETLDAIDATLRERIRQMGGREA